MKNSKLLFLLFLMGCATSFSQSEGSGGATDEGNWVIEINTGFGEASKSNTGFSFVSIDGYTQWSIGAEAGYFLLDNLALKAGLGYMSANEDESDTDATAFNWKFGAKYYIAGQFPVGVDVNGSTVSVGDFDLTPMYVGFQAGYAWFVADNVSIEPGLRYGLGMNEDAGDGDLNPFSANIGFNVYF